MSTVRIDSPEQWAHACSAAFVPLGVRATGRAFHAHLRQVALPGGLRITRVASERSEVFRSARVIAQTPRDDILLAFHEKGRGRVHQDDRTASLVAGTAALYDTAAPYTLDFPSTMVETIVQFPRSVLRREGQALDDLTARVIPRSGLTRAVEALAACALTEETDGDAAAFGESISCLLAAAFGQAPSTAPTLVTREALGRLMARFIDEHSSDPDLDPTELALVHHVSLRTVHNAFASIGTTPAVAIRSARLQKARNLLLSGYAVRVAATTSGFADLDTFTRAYRREYGITPTVSKRVAGSTS